jgi:EAL domain-containing protein (putative c-di-GMP-specific phosphodiesterase class I)
MMEEVAFPPHRLEVEITESAFIRDMASASRLIHAFKAHGVSVALDDFGTGYSSLSHLSELPFDKIKIDRSFVQTMRERPQSATIVNAIIGLGHSMHLRTTAEGIEDPDDETMLRDLGCISGQGFLYSKPVPAEDVAAFVAQFKSQALTPVEAA